jgi:hypothetical protein
LLNIIRENHNSQQNNNKEKPELTHLKKNGAGYLTDILKKILDLGVGIKVVKVVKLEFLPQVILSR